MSDDKRDNHHADDVHDSIESSGRPSSDVSSSTGSSDSTSNSDESTLIEEISPPTELAHRGLVAKSEGIKMDTTDGGASNSITSTESVRRYKNSPFGLSHHYLTMPDPSPEQIPIRGLNRTVTTHRRNQKSRMGQREWKKEQRRSRTVVGAKETNPQQHDRYRDLSILAPISNASQSSLSSPSSSWPREYNGQSPSAEEVLSHSHNLDGKDHGEDDAMGAGLDAKQCNSKQLQLSTSARSADTNYLCGARQEPNFRNMEELKTYQGHDRLLVRFGSIMYATFLVILGCILHCSELRQKSKNSTDHIYTIVVALMGIGWLLFLQGDLQRYKRYASEYILIESIFNDHKQKMREMSQVGELAPPTAFSSASSSSASLMNDRMSMNTEVIFKKTAYKMYQRRAAAQNGQLGLASSAGKFAPNNCSNETDFRFLRSASSSSSSVANINGKGKTLADATNGIGIDQRLMEHPVPAYKFLHGKMGANFYLKCGMAAFCFGHVIHEGLRFGQQLYFFGTGNVHCRDLAALVAHLITPLYSFYQLFMMFKYSNLVINRHRVLAKFGLMHIVGTSITFWIRTILEEAYEDFVHKMDYFKSNKFQNATNLLSSSPLDSGSMLNLLTNAVISEASERSEQSAPKQNVSVAQTVWALMSSPISATITPQIARHLPESYACAQNTLLTTKSMNALPYLYPFTIEYNLLLAATFISLYFNIGKIGPHGSGCRPFTAHSDELKRIGIRHHSRSSFSNSPISHLESSDHMSTLKVARKDLGEYKSNFVVNADCHSANKGLFCGFFVLLVTLVTIVIFFVTINKPTHVQLGIKINLIQEGVLTTFLLVVMIIAFKQVSKLNRSPYSRDKVTTDDVLMLIPLPFFFFHSLLSFRAETATLYQSDFSHGSAKLHEFIRSNNQTINLTNFATSQQINHPLMSHRNTNESQLIENFINDTSRKTDISGDDHDNRKGRGSSNIDAGNDSSQIDHFKLINVALNIVVMIEVLVQTNFIIDGMRRCSESRYLRFKKPGRELITFAILLNITYWIVATFETKSVEQYKPEIEYYGPLPYMFISHTTLPVMLFYRYHSSVCLAEIWNRAYKPPKQR